MSRIPRRSRHPTPQRPQPHHSHPHQYAEIQTSWLETRVWLSFTKKVAHLTYSEATRPPHPGTSIHLAVSLETVNLLIVPNPVPKYYQTKNPLAQRSVSPARGLVPPATSSLSWTPDKTFFEALATMRQLSVTTPFHLDASFAELSKRGSLHLDIPVEDDFVGCYPRR
jgi:hypothetical protein